LKKIEKKKSRYTGNSILDEVEQNKKYMTWFLCDRIMYLPIIYIALYFFNYLKPRLVDNLIT